jgi:hypothetical protein
MSRTTNVTAQQATAVSTTRGKPRSAPPRPWAGPTPPATPKLRDIMLHDLASLQVEAILNAGLAPFETFIEVVTHVRQKHHTGYLRENIDKLLQKNTAWGALVQGRSKVNPRRWHLGGRLLEVLVHLVLRVRPFARGPDENRSLDRGLKLDYFFGDTATSSSALHQMRRSDRYCCKVP